MGILDFLRRKKQVEDKTESNPEKDLSKVVINDEKVNAILEEEIKDFFPDTGVWYSNCFGRPSEVEYGNLPCHLRDNAWMSRLLYNNLQAKKIHIPIHIPQYTIKKFMDNSDSFAKLRHDYELKIVEWQIHWIINGGEGWCMPKGYDEFALLFSEDVDKIVRGGVVKTLRAIGMDSEVIEEGLEKYSDIWRPYCMKLGFKHIYDPVIYLKGKPEMPPSEEHKKNWLADREYQYYQTHKHSVDSYGTLTPAMQMSPEEYSKLTATLEKQNEMRKSYITMWRNNKYRIPQHNSTNENEDILSK